METLSKQTLIYYTHYGLKIYAHVLRLYYPGQTVLFVSGNACTPTRNPFNGDQPTLLITIENQVAYHRDSSKAIPAGDAFDFACLHYKQSGNELLHTLNRELFLHIGKKRGFYSIRTPEKNRCMKEMVDTKKTLSGDLANYSFSYFKAPVTNTAPYQTVTLSQVHSTLLHRKNPAATCNQ